MTPNQKNNSLANLPLSKVIRYTLFKTDYVEQMSYNIQASNGTKLTKDYSNISSNF